MLSDDDIIERGGTQEDIDRYAHDVGGACSAEFGNCDMCQPPAKSEDELQAGIGELVHGRYHAVHDWGTPLVSKIMQLIRPYVKQEAEAHADAVIGQDVEHTKWFVDITGEYDYYHPVKRPLVERHKNELRAEQRKSNVYPL